MIFIAITIRSKAGNAANAVVRQRRFDGVGILHSVSFMAFPATDFSLINNGPVSPRQLVDHWVTICFA